jgi:hypothetical protein
VLLALRDHRLCAPMHIPMMQPRMLVAHPRDTWRRRRDPVFRGDAR